MRKQHVVLPPVVRAVGYVRVSKSLASGVQELSPQVQAEKIKAMATLQGVRLVELVTERESAKEGSVKKRPGLVRILEMGRRHEIDRIIIAKLDRLTRSVVDLGSMLTLLDKHGISLVSATETWMDTSSAAGRMILNVVTSVAQWEREAIAERTTAVLRYKRDHNQVYNHPPFGYDRKERGKWNASKKRHEAMLVPDPKEQLVILRIKRLRKQGKTLRVIADKLNAEKVPTKIKGGTWYASTVNNVLRIHG
jgi:site-specific DNA recombinase